jgi:hypothetical protein
VTTLAFPTLYPNPLVEDGELQRALDRAIEAGPGRAWRTPVAIVSLGPDGARPMAQFRGDEVHFSASLLKVAAMYAAFELRNTLRGIAAELGTRVTAPELLKAAATYLDPQITIMAGNIPALRGVAGPHALPQYASAFEVGPPAGPEAGPGVDFAPRFASHLDRMIAVSDNGSAAQCVHGVGYGYLNGALVSAGLFDPTSNVGLWLAGDYAGSYPYYRIRSVNDGLVAQAATVTHLAQLYTLLHDGLLVDERSSQEMLALLARAVAVPEVFIDRASGLDFRVTHTKVGLGPLKPENGGTSVYSEGSILRHASGRQFVAVWQNFVFGDEGFDPIGWVVRDTIRGYLGG